jgi:hypothetical protein
MREDLAGRLEQTRARALALLGGGGSTERLSRKESSEGRSWPPDEDDAQSIALRMRSESNIQPERALALAREMVERARAALDKDYLSDMEALALECVIHVRGRPALRILNSYLESLDNFPGSELWQNLITEFERRIISSAAATGGIFVENFTSGNPRWLQGTAWMVAPDRVVTNRHVLLPKSGERIVDQGVCEIDARVRDGFKIEVDFAADNRKPATNCSRRVTGILFVAKECDPVDVAILEIEPNSEAPPLILGSAATEVPKNLYIVGHPALSAVVPDEVKAVFSKPDGKKRVSFGQLLSIVDNEDIILHDASTIGGYSGGPVIGVSGKTVLGLHFYGDPSAGNYAVAAKALRNHPVQRFLGP